MRDADAQPELPLPDHVPDELVAAYGPEARRAVRSSRSSWRGPVADRLRRGRAAAGDREVWLVALTVFSWSIVAAGAVGALVYATFLFPWVGFAIVLPVAALAVVSVGVGVAVTRRQGRELETAAS